MLNLGRLHTVIRIFLLNLRGRNIKIGKNTVISRNAHIVGRGLVIGDDCYIGCYTFLDSSNGHIVIGDKTSLGRFCMVHGGVAIGDTVRIASHVVLVPADHKFMDRNVLIKDQGVINRGIVVGSDVWLAAGVKVLSGSAVEDGCVVGAGAVVKGQLDAYGVYVGVPARKILGRT